MRTRMNATALVEKFKGLLQREARRRNLTCGQWFGGTGRFSDNIVNLEGNWEGDWDLLLYVRASSGKGLFWGVTKSRIDEFRQSGSDWRIVLLAASPEAGYLLFPHDYDQCVSTGLWRLCEDGDYRTSPGPRLAHSLAFGSVAELLDILAEHRRRG